ncbi:hypothetical protein SAMN05421837_101361 [Amycolatopsis pretoriensis]|uniref:3-(3-hydroxy-phenyl)propionate hydroxylase n=1 Tax=Amycolatopsis pretoriensis TaxID=218821 RepID=A0A1H5Q2V3_9PSEU|nr:hypothetical protein [Amycolatopsis pretoriensis]SEF20430.1 hypothetical protein SAMN05421837_101361 [Amycolatopsis pretoriensis]
MATRFRDGRAVVLDPGTASAAAEWGSRVEVVTARPLAFPDRRPAALVRPDGYVVWASVGEFDEGELRSVLERWLGPADRS